MRVAVVIVQGRHAPPSRAALSLVSALTCANRQCTLVWAVPEGLAHDIRAPTAEADVLYLQACPPVAQSFPDLPLFRLADQIAPTLHQFDIVYALCWGHPAVQLARQRRFAASRLPFVVTILDETLESTLRQQHRFPSGLAEINQAFGERYQVQHSDWLICLKPMLGELSEVQRWNMPADECVRSVGVEDAPWFRLHEEVEAAASRAASTPRTPRRLMTHPAVTVCVPYFNHGEYLAAALESLARQTTDDFTTIVVDDGSTSHASRVVFDQLGERYAGRGWRFFRQRNAGPSAARNFAASQSRSEYLLFFDADDIAAPRLVERLLTAARYSWADSLAAWLYRFPEDSQYDFADRQSVWTPTRLYSPPGNDPIANLLHDFHGGAVCLIRRDAFEQVGGFPEDSRMGEDYALHTRIAAAGYDCDVLPEYLCCQRDTQSGLLKSGLEFDAYGAIFPTPGHFAAIHLPSFDVAFRALQERKRRAERSLAMRRQALEHRFHRRGRKKGLRLLLLIPHWPYPPITGALAVMWERIRYLGQRHDVTLATFWSPGDGRHKRKLLRYCQRVYAVRRSGLALPGSQSLPFVVRKHQSAEMHETLQSIPTRLFDAAVMDQFIMAPYLDDLETPTILAEHGIFSTMLDQVSDRSYGPLTPDFENPKDEIQSFRSFEDRTWPRFPLRTAVSEVDRSEIQRRAKVGQTIVVEIGTDPGLRRNRLRHDTQNVLFVGMLSWYPNVDAILYFWREIWPHLLRLNPTLDFVIAGYTPGPEIRALARESGVTVIASPRDIGPIADKTSVTVVPLRIGTGVRVKILNAMSMGLPVVTTAVGCEGLAVEDGEHLLIRDHPIAFAEAVHEVLRTPSLWQRLRRNGLELVEQRYRWDRVFEPLDQALWQLASR
jgi:glycosyltransferase involved in cell wall biosynthesis